MAISGVTVVGGYAREATFAYFFGTSGELDAFLVALTLPQLLMLLVGKITVMVVLPIYVAHREHQRLAEASEVVRRWFWFSAVVVGVVCLGLFALAPQMVSWLAPGLPADKVVNAARWLRWLLPFLWVTGVASSFRVVLDTHRRFAAPAAASAVISFSVVAACFLLGKRFGVSAAVPGFLVGAVLVYATQWLRSRQLEPAVPGFRRLAGPVELPFAGASVMMISLVAAQFHFIIDRGFASTMAEGSIAALNYAKAVNQIPMTVASHALATALFPILATMTARGEWDVALRTLRRWMLIVAGVGIAPTLALIVLREPVISLLFERGQFGPEAVAVTASVLSVLPLTIVTASLSPLVERLLLAQQRIALLAGLSIVAIGLKVGLNVVFVSGLGMGLVGLAAATVLTSAVMVAVRYGFARSYRNGAGDGPAAEEIR